MSLFSFIFGTPDDDSAMPESQSFRIKYDGPALSQHEIDVNDLAPALMSLGDLMQEANRIANKNETKISIKVKATEPGSFQISIQAIQTAYNATVSLLTGADFTALVNLLSVFGFVGIGGGSIVYIIKKLKNRKPKIVSSTSTTVEIDTGDGIITISKLEWELLLSPKIRQSLLGILRPLEKDGIDAVEFIDVQAEVVSTKVTKSELSYFVPPKPEIEPLPEIPPRDTYVNVVHMWFRGGNKWKFSEGGNEWAAEIKDNKFLEKLLNGQVSIQSNDSFKVRVKQTQSREGSIIHSEYEIIEVLDQKHAGQQTEIDFS